MAPRFFGRFEHSLDAKGRAILPAKFRASFGEHAFLSQYKERCLALWTSDQFEEQLTEQAELQERGREERRQARFWASGAVEVDIDRQGRLAIPAFLRDYARLANEQPLLITGALDRVELWNPAEFAAKVLRAEAIYADEAGEAEEPEAS